MRMAVHLYIWLESGKNRMLKTNKSAIQPQFETLFSIPY